MSLQELEAKWRVYLAAESCPAVLGLAPLSEEESDAIHARVASTCRKSVSVPWHTLFAMLRHFPACLAVWLARKASEAYEAGAFWEQFGSLIGVEIPLNQRAAFAQRFRWASRMTMAAWLPPEDLGGHNIVAEFLHQAGLPLDRCEGFAQHVRKVERSVGLPDVEAADAGEQLREAVLESLQAIPVPTLKRALRGPAGPRICEVALRVVLHGDFTGINPQLGKELERVFAQAGPGALRRSAHQPFLRLGADCGSVEIVGPQQDASLIGPSGLTWIVDGRRFPTPRTDEFVLTVTDQRRVGVELTGLVLGAMPPRTFVLSLDDLTEPFMLFDARTHRQRRMSGPVPAGDYWLLHRTTDTLVGADQCYECPDGECSLSFFRILPGAEVRLESEHGGPWRFAAALTPFFDTVGECLIDESRETICFGWAEMPCVWLPLEETESEQLTQWHVHLIAGTLEQRWALSRTDEEAGGMAKCRIEAHGALVALAPGLHRLEFTLRRGERSRHEAKATYWFWQGLLKHDASGFQLSGPAMNLLPAECRGFGFGEGAIRHLADQHRRHTLVFDVDGSQMAFHWAQPGVFLESLERRPGIQAEPRPHQLGEAFPASCNSARWLRIWLAGQREWDIVVAGKVWHRGMGVDHRAFVELSFASLATAFPEGGDIRLRMHGRERLLARFSSPLYPLALDDEESIAHVELRFHFSERVLWVRLGLRELASSQRRVLDGQAFGPSGRCLFVSEDLPPIECSSVADEKRGTAFHLITLHVPKQGWPEGLWVIELEARRDENADWEPVALGGRDHAPLVIWASKGQSESTTRARLLWASVDPGAPLHDDNLDASGYTELFELLADVIGLRQRRIAAAVRRNLDVHFISSLPVR